MSSALPSASAAAVDVTSGATIAANNDDTDGTAIPLSSTKDEGAYVSASVEFKVTCFGAFTFADSA